MTSDLERLASSTDDSGHWSWPEDDKVNWKKVSTNHQFYKKWRSKPLDETQGFPYTLPLGTDKDGRPLLDFRYDATAGSKIVVTEAYKNTYDRILKLREAPGGRGVVLTGQPGIGKTIFLKYLLVRLISARQPVLLYANGFTLFYAGNVYQAIHMPLSHIPKSAGKNLYEIWMLIDADTDDKGPGLNGTAPIWPIQASPPHPKRWDAWVKQLKGAKWGMPLWTFDELEHGLHLQPEYKAFRENLEAALGPSISRDQAVIVALKILNRVKEEVDTDQEMPISVDAAIKILIIDAIAEYGRAPRDVYRAIFLPFDMMRERQQAITDLDYDNLHKLVTAFSSDRSETTHRIISVSPIPCGEGEKIDDWRADFSSDRIAKLVMLAMSMRMQEDRRRLGKMYAAFCNFSGGSRWARCVFEAIAHQRLSEGSWPEGLGVPIVIRMDSDGKETPSFSESIPTSGTALPVLPCTNKTDSEIIDLNRRTLNDFEPKLNTYYILTSTAADPNPLFDSFTITLDDAGPGSTALISVFQVRMTVTIPTSHPHPGAKEGYALVHGLSDRVRKRYIGIIEKIQIVYWLVCPAKGESCHGEWKMENARWVG